jgi:hypothetical protein
VTGNYGTVPMPSEAELNNHALAFDDPKNSAGDTSTFAETLVRLLHRWHALVAFRNKKKKTETQTYKPRNTVQQPPTYLPTHSSHFDLPILAMQCYTGATRTNSNSCRSTGLNSGTTNIHPIHPIHPHDPPPQKRAIQRLRL